MTKNRFHSLVRRPYWRQKMNVIQREISSQRKTEGDARRLVRNVCIKNLDMKRKEVLTSVINEPSF